MRSEVNSALRKTSATNGRIKDKDSWQIESNFFSYFLSFLSSRKKDILTAPQVEVLTQVETATDAQKNTLLDVVIPFEREDIGLSIHIEKIWNYGEDPNSCDLSKFSYPKLTQDSFLSKKDFKRCVSLFFVQKEKGFPRALHQTFQHFQNPDKLKNIYNFLILMRESQKKYSKDLEVTGSSTLEKDLTFLIQKIEAVLVKPNVHEHYIAQESNIEFKIITPQLIESSILHAKALNDQMKGKFSLDYASRLGQRGGIFSLIAYNGATDIRALSPQVTAGASSGDSLAASAFDALYDFTAFFAASPFFGFWNRSAIQYSEDIAHDIKLNQTFLENLLKISNKQIDSSSNNSGDLSQNQNYRKVFSKKTIEKLNKYRFQETGALGGITSPLKKLLSYFVGDKKLIKKEIDNTIQAFISYHDIKEEFKQIVCDTRTTNIGGKFYFVKKKLEKLKEEIKKRVEQEFSSSAQTNQDNINKITNQEYLNYLNNLPFDCEGIRGTLYEHLLIQFEYSPIDLQALIEDWEIPSIAGWETTTATDVTFSLEAKLCHHIENVVMQTNWNMRNIAVQTMHNLCMLINKAQGISEEGRVRLRNILLEMLCEDENGAFKELRHKRNTFGTDMAASAAGFHFYTARRTASFLSHAAVNQSPPAYVGVPLGGLGWGAASGIQPATEALASDDTKTYVSIKKCLWIEKKYFEGKVSAKPNVHSPQYSPLLAARGVDPFPQRQEDQKSAKSPPLKDTSPLFTKIDSFVHILSEKYELACKKKQQPQDNLLASQQSEQEQRYQELKSQLFDHGMHKFALETKRQFSVRPELTTPNSPEIKVQAKDPLITEIVHRYFYKEGITQSLAGTEKEVQLKSFLADYFDYEHNKDIKDIRQKYTTKHLCSMLEHFLNFEFDKKGELLQEKSAAIEYIAEKAIKLYQSKEEYSSIQNCVKKAIEYYFDDSEIIYKAVNIFLNEDPQFGIKGRDLETLFQRADAKLKEENVFEEYLSLMFNKNSLKTRDQIGFALFHIFGYLFHLEKQENKEPFHKCLSILKNKFDHVETDKSSQLKVLQQLDQKEIRKQKAAWRVGSGLAYGAAVAGLGLAAVASVNTGVIPIFGVFAVLSRAFLNISRSVVETINYDEDERYYVWAKDFLSIALKSSSATLEQPIQAKKLNLEDARQWDKNGNVGIRSKKNSSTTSSVSYGNNLYQRYKDNQNFRTELEPFMQLSAKISQIKGTRSSAQDEMQNQTQNGLIQNIQKEAEKILILKLFELPYSHCNKADAINKTTEFLALLSNVPEELVPEERKCAFLHVLSHFLLNAKGDYTKLFVHQNIFAEKKYFIPETVSAFFFSWGALTSTFFPGMFDFITSNDAVIRVFDSLAATIGDVTGCVILGLNGKTEQYTKSFQAIFKPIKMLLVEYGLNMLKEKDYSTNFKHKFSQYHDHHTGKSFTLENTVVRVGKLKELKNLIEHVQKSRDLTIHLDGLKNGSQEYESKKGNLKEQIEEIKDSLDIVKFEKKILNKIAIFNENNNNGPCENEHIPFSDIAERFPVLKELELNIDTEEMFNSIENDVLSTEEKQKKEKEKLLKIFNNLEVFLSKLKVPEDFYDSLFDNLRKTISILEVETGFWPSSSKTRSMEIFCSDSEYPSHENLENKKV